MVEFLICLICFWARLICLTSFWFSFSFCLTSLFVASLVRFVWRFVRRFSRSNLGVEGGGEREEEEDHVVRKKKEEEVVFELGSEEIVLWLSCGEEREEGRVVVV